MFYYRITLEYEGTNYSGWQVQTGSNVKTIQGEVEKVLFEIFKSTNIKTIGSGRTDARVHAFAQVCKITAPLKIPEIALQKALNALLPDDIRVLNSCYTTDEFHPIFSATKKEYNYLFCLGPERAMWRNHATYLDEKLDLNLMKDGCKAFIGTHEFALYSCTGTEIEDTKRTILSCEIVPYEPQGFHGIMGADYHVFRVIGDGFLKQMVRLMFGALGQLGRGKITIKDIENSLQITNFHPSLKKLGPTAQPQGLYLREVHY
jgi:tRNA pseudouridine38-40 synthase